MTGLERLTRFHDCLGEAAHMLRSPEFTRRNIRTISQLANLARQYQDGQSVPRTACELKLSAIAKDLIEAKSALPITLDPVEPAGTLDALLDQLQRRPMFSGRRNSL